MWKELGGEVPKGQSPWCHPSQNPAKVESPFVVRVKGGPNSAFQSPVLSVPVLSLRIFIAFSLDTFRVQPLFSPANSGLDTPF